MRSNNNTQHVAENQPLIHLFTVPLNVVQARVSNGSKWADKKVPKPDLKKKGGK